jgi:opacity protein-like surface antigen
MNVSHLRGAVFPHRQKSAGSRHRLSRGLAAVAVFALSGICCITTSAIAQSEPTATRIGDLQVGGGFVFARSDYNFTPIKLIGGAAYTTFDWRNHWGGEFDFRQNQSTANSTVYERTYEIGPRIFLHRGPLIPYAKALYGRGVYNFTDNIANVAYNIYTFGGGADYQITRSINIRADYEFQTWVGFPISNLHPNVITAGVAYHFHE